MRPFAFDILACFLMGYPALAGAQCPAGLTALTEAKLFFGLSIGAAGIVSEAEWQRFTDEEITPRFPAGLTIEDAHGQWKGTSGIARENTKHLIVVLPRGDTGKLEAIRTAYKSRFHQDSVLLLESRVCGSF